MQIQALDKAPVNERGGQRSYLLLGGGQFGSKNLAIMGTVHPTTWAGEILVGAEGLPKP